MAHSNIQRQLHAVFYLGYNTARRSNVKQVRVKGLVLFHKFDHGTVQDFKDTLHEVRPSVSPNELRIYNNRNNQFGSISR